MFFRINYHLCEELASPFGRELCTLSVTPNGVPALPEGEPRPLISRRKADSFPTEGEAILPNLSLDSDAKLVPLVLLSNTLKGT